MKKVSEMLLEVAGDLLTMPENRDEMQAHLDLVKQAWNMSLYSKKKRKSKLNCFIESQRPYAPNIEALKGLEWEFRRVMSQKDELYPTVKNKIEYAEVIETDKDSYIIRAYFTSE